VDPVRGNGYRDAHHGWMTDHLTKARRMLESSVKGSYTPDQENKLVALAGVHAQLAYVESTVLLTAAVDQIRQQMPRAGDGRHGRIVSVIPTSEKWRTTESFRRDDGTYATLDHEVIGWAVYEDGSVRVVFVNDGCNAEIAEKEEAALIVHDQDEEDDGKRLPSIRLSAAEMSSSLEEIRSAIYQTAGS
jgi:hypothetical protein